MVQIQIKRLETPFIELSVFKQLTEKKYFFQN